MAEEVCVLPYDKLLFVVNPEIEVVGTPVIFVVVVVVVVLFCAVLFNPYFFKSMSVKGVEPPTLPVFVIVVVVVVFCCWDPSSPNDFKSNPPLEVDAFILFISIPYCFKSIGPVVSVVVVFVVWKYLLRSSFPSIGVCDIFCSIPNSFKSIGVEDSVWPAWFPVVVVVVVLVVFICCKFDIAEGFCSRPNCFKSIGSVVVLVVVVCWKYLL